MKEAKCSHCGKPLTESDHCICDSCYSNNINRILQQARDKAAHARLEQERLMASTGELKKKISALNEEKNRL